MTVLQQSILVLSEPFHIALLSMLAVARTEYDVTSLQLNSNSSLG